ncbi:MAG: ABC transporter permease [Candidatus Sumerlaeia bacterium]
MTNESYEIQDQVRLPMNVAMQVVMQGIRIRFGRSIVTIMGVVLGIAFLMAILTGQIIKEGVTEEDALRVEVKRMYSFLEAEMGPPEGRTVGIVSSGPINEAERRLVGRLVEKGAKTLLWADLSEKIEMPRTKKTELKQVSLAQAASNVSAILVMGDEELSADQWEQLFSNSENRNICLTRKDEIDVTVPDASFVTLARELQPEEIKKMAEERRKQRFRNIWIVIISLLVTVIGISNAMLMSVTERFREIGTMKCLGALSRFIRTIFLIEASVMGVVGAISGCIIGILFSIIAYMVVYGAGLTFSSISPLWLMLYAVFSILAGLVLSIIAAIYPANVASKMVPADALRTNI